MPSPICAKAKLKTMIGNLLVKRDELKLKGMAMRRKEEGSGGTNPKTPSGFGIFVSQYKD